jgi:plastocyanin
MKSRLYPITHLVSTSRFGMALFGSLAMAVVASAPAAKAAPTDPSGGNSVSIADFAFAPAEITVAVGTTLTWTNTQTSVPHTTTALDGSWDSSALTTGDSFNFTFTQPGDFAYQCTIHPTMRGIVHVAGDATTQATTDAVTTDPAPPVAPPAAPSTNSTAGIPTLTPTATPAIPAVATPSPTPHVIPVATTPTATPAPYYKY